MGIAPCEWRRLSDKADDVHYCGACGCGDNPKTWLDTPPNEPDAYTKLDYPKVVCLIFGSGKMVITGARHKDEILEAVQIIQDELADLL